jgi:TetR/AcrR family transcriptional repressor of lmrAB and yxaGH operons
MTDGARDRMVDSAIKLLATRGFQGASFSTILDDSKAPRGSIYYHFPGGKDELILEAMGRFRDRAAAILGTMRSLGAEDAVAAFVDLWRQILIRSDFRAGCAVLGATVSADAADVVNRAAEVFRAWRGQLTSVLQEAGIPVEEAGDLSDLLMAACEGAVVLCRAERSLLPLDRVERQLRRLAALSVTR